MERARSAKVKDEFQLMSLLRAECECVYVCKHIDVRNIHVGSTMSTVSPRYVSQPLNLILVHILQYIE